MSATSDFEFSVDDLLSGSSEPFQREQKKNLPTDKAISTSRSHQNTTGDLASAEMSTLDVGQILMGMPLFDDLDNAVAKQDKLMSDMLGVAIKHDDTNLGQAFQELTPSDVLNEVAQIQDSHEGESLNDDNKVASGAVDPITGLVSGALQATAGAGATTASDGSSLLATGRVIFTGSAYPKGQNDMVAGKFSPNLIFALSVVTTQFVVTITSANDGATHVKNSLHYKFQAVDIGTIKDISTNQSLRIAGPNPMILKFLSLLNTITGPRRPDEVISPMNPGYPGMWSQQDHQDHIHLGIEAWGDPLPKAAPVSTGGTRTGAQL